MRDPARIEKILSQLRTLWYLHPNTRFGQLVDYALKTSSGDPFYLEDDIALGLITVLVREDSHG